MGSFYKKKYIRIIANIFINPKISEFIRF